MQAALAPSLAALERTAALEILSRRVGIGGRSVVGRDDYQSVVVNPELFQAFCKPTDLVVDVGNHRGICGMRIKYRVVPPAVCYRGLLFPQFFHIVHHLVLRRLDGGMRHSGGPHQEERLAASGSIAYPVLQPLEHQVA